MKNRKILFYLVLALLLIPMFIFAAPSAEKSDTAKDSNISGAIEYVSMWNIGEPQALFIQEMAEYV